MKARPTPQPRALFGACLSWLLLASLFCSCGTKSSPICQPGARECKGANAKYCHADGTRWITEDCTDGTLCQLGSCRKPLTPCVVGDAVCVRGIAMSCLKDGSWDRVQCQQGELCSNGKCLQLPAKCTPGKTLCDVGKLLTCRPAGDGWSEAPCPQGHLCLNGACQAPPTQGCTPGQKKCLDEATTALCDDRGTWHRGSCPKDQVCTSGECAAKGPGPVCTPNAKSCKSESAARVCQADGTWREIPCDEGQVCTSGECAAKGPGPACTPNAKSCKSESIARVCQADGTWREIPCQGNQRCLGTQCEASPSPSTTWPLGAPRTFTPAQLEAMGYYDVTRTQGVDPTGKKDSTKGLQAAVQYALSKWLVAYFPQGRYLISNKLQWAVKQNHKGCYQYKGNISLLGDSRGAQRPTLVLAPKSSGFGDRARPKPMLRIIMEDRLNKLKNYDSVTNCIYASTIRGLKFVTGANPGAVAIDFGAAQESFIEDIEVDATGGFAGIMGMPGRGAANVNIKITGGEYGFWLLEGAGQSLGGSIVGATLIGQSKAAILSNVWRGLSITGFHIQKKQGPVIETSAQDVQAGNIAMLDGTIQVDDANSVVLDNSDDKLLALRNVYIRGGKVLVKSGSRSTPRSGQGWAHIRRYIPCPRRVSGAYQKGAVSVVNGVQGCKDTVELASVQAPPSDLLSRHTWTKLPTFEYKAVHNAADSGANGNDDKDDRKAIQDALDKHDMVFLPKGRYYLSGPLTLRPHNALFGVMGQRTQLAPTPGFNASGAYLVQTENVASAITYLGDIVIGTPNHKDNKLGGLHWRLGGRSMVKSVRVGDIGAGRLCEIHPIILTKISENGGGRWYRWLDHMFGNKTTQTAHPQFRKLAVINNRQPLTFYGFNPEHGYASPMISLRGARNVRILGNKTEAPHHTFEIYGGQNIYMQAVFANPNSKVGFIHIDRSDDLELVGVLSLTKGGSGFALQESFNGTKTTVSATKLLTHFQRGKVDDGAWKIKP